MKERKKPKKKSDMRQQRRKVASERERREPLNGWFRSIDSGIPSSFPLPL